LRCLTESLAAMERQLNSVAGAPMPDLDSSSLTSQLEGLLQGVLADAPATDLKKPRAVLAKIRGLQSSLPPAISGGKCLAQSWPSVKWQESSTDMYYSAPAQSPMQNMGPPGLTQQLLSCVAGAQGGSLPAANPIQAAHKPVREKVNSKDLTKFDIIPERILAGQDPRTTVMVRNIPKACSREHIIEHFGSFGLNNRYTFFYMPFDKRRNIHCGFAFVNLKTPADILKLHAGFLRSNMTPAVSYARLQGEDQLRKHFSLSAVMYDNDTWKRPVFTNQEGGDGHAESSCVEPWRTSRAAADADMFADGIGA